MRLSNIGNILLKIFAGIFAVISGYLMCINIFSNYGRLLPMNKLIVVLGAIIILAILLILKHIFITFLIIYYILIIIIIEEII